MRYLIWSQAMGAWYSETGTTRDISTAKVYDSTVAIVEAIHHPDPDDLQLIPYPQDVEQEIGNHILECEEVLNGLVTYLGLPDDPVAGYRVTDHGRILSELARRLGATPQPPLTPEQRVCRFWTDNEDRSIQDIYLDPKRRERGGEEWVRVMQATNNAQLTRQLEAQGKS